MNNKSIKTAIIVLLAAANIFLVSNILALDLRARHIPADMIANASDILRAHGIDAPAGIIPAVKPAYRIYEGVFPDYHDIVRSFTGASDEEVETGWYPTPDGLAVVYNVGRYQFIFEENMRVSIASAGFDAEPAGFGEGGDADWAAQVIAGFLGRYAAQDPRAGFELTGLERSGDIYRAAVSQTVDGILIASHSAHVIISGGEVKYFSGRWHFGELSGGYGGSGYRMPLLDAVNILFRAMEQGLYGARLEYMGSEYTVKPHGAGMFYLAPSWVLGFECGKRLSYDMITGVKNN